MCGSNGRKQSRQKQGWSALQQHRQRVFDELLEGGEELRADSAVYGAVMARFGASPLAVADLGELQGAVWPRALLFSAVMMLCFLAFGLYSLRQRARLAGMAARVAVALFVGFAFD